MTAVNGPKVVSDGLVFAYDILNTQKSWKGKPITNLTTDSPTMNGWAGTYTIVDSSTKTFLIQTTQYNATTTSAWRTWYWSVSSYIGQTVTISADVVFVEETDCNFSSITIGQGNTGSYPYHIAGSDAVDRVTISTKPLSPIHMTWTGTINDTGVVGFTQWIANVTADGGNAVLKISNVQIEVSDYETPFVNGTRSDTQSLLDLTKNNTITLSSDMMYDSDNSFYYEGVGGVGISGSYLNCGNSDILDLGTGNFTLNFVTYRTANGYQNGSYVSKGNGTSLGFDFRDSNFYVHGSSGLIAQIGFSATWNIWQHHAFVFDRSSSPYIKYYLNGVHTSSSNTNNAGNVGSSINTSRLLEIGRSQAGGVNRYFNGKMPCVYIYNRALTADEVLNNYEATKNKYI